eukprot:7151305-Prymnesium_polylepis.1
MVFEILLRSGRPPARGENEEFARGAPSSNKRLLDRRYSSDAVAPLVPCWVAARGHHAQAVHPTQRQSEETEEYLRMELLFRSCPLSSTDVPYTYGRRGTSLEWEIQVARYSEHQRLACKAVHRVACQSSVTRDVEMWLGPALAD